VQGKWKQHCHTVVVVLQQLLPARSDSLVIGILMAAMPKASSRIAATRKDKLWL